MAIKYDLWPMPKNPLRKDQPEGIMYARTVRGRTVGTKEIIRNIQEISAFTKGDAEGLITLLKQEIINHLTNGDSVRIDGIGTFNVKLRSRGVSKKDEIRSGSVSVEDVTFLASPELKEEVRKAELIRSESGFQASQATYTKKNRYQELKNLLKKEQSISVKRYAEYSGLRPSTANRELNEWVKQGKLIREGFRPNLKFKLP